MRLTLGLHRTGDTSQLQFWLLCRTQVATASCTGSSSSGGSDHSNCTFVTLSLCLDHRIPSKQWLTCSSGNIGICGDQERSEPPCSVCYVTQWEIGPESYSELQWLNWLGDMDTQLSPWHLQSVARILLGDIISRTTEE